MDSLWQEVKLLGQRVLAPPARLMTRHRARVLVYHRFGASAVTRALQPAVFERHLQFLTAHYTVVSLSTLVDSIMARHPFVPDAVAITVDDGYADFLTWCYPLLERYRVPATFFVTTDLVSGVDWLWFDKIRHCVLTADAGVHDLSVVLPAAGQVPLMNEPQRMLWWNRLADEALPMAPAVRARFIDALSSRLGVRLPQSAPPEYAGVSWSDLRRLSADLVEIGSHTRSHPVLAKCSNEQLGDEVTTSKRVIEEEIGRSVSFFAYPNGLPADISESAVDAVRQAGYRAGLVVSGRLVGGDEDLMRMSRMAAPASLDGLRWQLAGAHSW